MIEAATQPDSSASTNAGGLAPEHRRCHYTRSTGHRCRDWALHGREHCFRHDRYLHALPDRPLHIPLLEDEDSITYVLSQALQALAWGTIPVSNGRAILNGCRLAHTMQNRRLEAARLRLRARRLGIPEHEIFDTPPAKPEPEVPAANAAHQPDPANAESEPTPNPQRERPKYLAFRDLKKNWDKELLRTENEMMDMAFKRNGETKEEFLAARATPFDNLQKEETATAAAL
ncbi:MAG TPA: hypothetical protein VHE33_04620 [Acidobacteriaceae bacterium]|nr:hypothetical protein [Acidobacteriaceae bacterium]